MRDKLDKYYKLILRDQPQATWPPYNYEPLKLILKPAYDEMKGNWLNRSLYTERHRFNKNEN